MELSRKQILVGTAAVCTAVSLIFATVAIASSQWSRDPVGDTAGAPAADAPARAKACVSRSCAANAPRAAFPD
jgi:hypothetical protein